MFHVLNYIPLTWAWVSCFMLPTIFLLLGLGFHVSCFQLCWSNLLCTTQLSCNMSRYLEVVEMSGSWMFFIDCLLFSIPLLFMPWSGPVPCACTISTLSIHCDEIVLCMYACISVFIQASGRHTIQCHSSSFPSFATPPLFNYFSFFCYRLEHLFSTNSREKCPPAMNTYMYLHPWGNCQPTLSHVHFPWHLCQPVVCPIFNDNSMFIHCLFDVPWHQGIRLAFIAPI